MVPADKRPGAPASPLHLDWEPNGSWLRCVVRWPDTRPPLSRVLPLFGHLGLDLADHRPEGTTDTFVFSRVEDPRLDEGIHLYNEGHHWHAHESWEPLWMGLEGDEKLFLQGLIMSAAMLHQYQRRVAGGVRNHWANVEIRLPPHRP